MPKRLTAEGGTNWKGAANPSQCLWVSPEDFLHLLMACGLCWPLNVFAAS